MTEELGHDAPDGALCVRVDIGTYVQPRKQRPGAAGESGVDPGGEVGMEVALDDHQPVLEFMHKRVDPAGDGAEGIAQRAADQIVVTIELEVDGVRADLGIKAISTKSWLSGVQRITTHAGCFLRHEEREEEILAVLDPHGLVEGIERTEEDTGGGNDARRQVDAAGGDAERLPGSHLAPRYFRCSPPLPPLDPPQ